MDEGPEDEDREAKPVGADGAQKSSDSKKKNVRKVVRPVQDEPAAPEDELTAPREGPPPKLPEDKLARPPRAGPITYYRAVLISLTIMAFICVFFAMEMVLSWFSFTVSLGDVPASLSPILGRSHTRLVGMTFVLALVAVVLHLRDSRRNLMVSLLPTMILMVIYGALMVASPQPDASAYAVFSGLLVVTLLDFYGILNYPPVLKRVGRSGLHGYVEGQQREEKLKDWILEEEERVRKKEGELDGVRAELAQKSKLVMEEEEELHRMESEITSLKAEVTQHKEQLMEEEESLRTMEQELSKVKMETADREGQLMEEEERVRSMEEELTRTKMEMERRQSELFEEEERIKSKEEDSIRIGADYEIQKKFMDELKDKQRMMEEELISMREEFERQVRVKIEEEEKLRLKKAASLVDSSAGRSARSVYPFTAIVGQDRMKLALILNAINPEIGGVLIKGQKGTGKSIAIRGLAEILPEISVVEGCRYNCEPEDAAHFCSDCRLRRDKGVISSSKRPIRVVDLPLNTTEDRLVGSIDIEKVLSEGVRAFEPGLLAEAHRGILHVDEINLLDDYVVDILLDSAASGVVAVEREGISISYPARFIIVGSMNPEEGELRPQLLDRLALSVDVVTIQGVTERVEIVRRMEEFTTSTVAFRDRFAAQQAALKDRITKARALVSLVTVPRPLLTDIANLCITFKVEGHRADIIVQRAAVANAAYYGRTTVTREDIEVGAELALPHRMKRRSFEKADLAVETIRRYFSEGAAKT
jgi:Mg-chelatase subunit ChlI